MCGARCVPTHTGKIDWFGRKFKVLCSNHPCMTQRAGSPSYHDSSLRTHGRKRTGPIAASIARAVASLWM